MSYDATALRHQIWSTLGVLASAAALNTSNVTVLRADTARRESAVDYQVLDEFLTVKLEPESTSTMPTIMDQRWHEPTSSLDEPYIAEQYQRAMPCTMSSIN